MKDHCRLALKRIKEEIPGIEITLLRQHRHFVFELKHEGRVRHISISVTPKNYDHTILNAVKDAKRLMAADK